jgi:hypothetical protein
MGFAEALVLLILLAFFYSLFFLVPLIESFSRNADISYFVYCVYFFLNDLVY